MASPVPGQTKLNISVSAEVDKLIKSKTLEALSALEGQVKIKLQSDEAIDVEYWESLMQSVRIYKAKAELRLVYQNLLESKSLLYRKEQLQEAVHYKTRLHRIFNDNTALPQDDDHVFENPTPAPFSATNLHLSEDDSTPDLKLRPEDKRFDILEETEFLHRFVSSTGAFYRAIISLPTLGNDKTSGPELGLCPPESTFIGEKINNRVWQTCIQ